jgi:phosphohistidine phosphatase SixA
MRLYLLRHADATTGKTEGSCELTPKGINSIRILTDFLSKKVLKEITEIRHSPQASARETARTFQEMAKLKGIVREEPLLEPYADFRILADLLDDSDKSLLLVGHRSNLGILASYLLTHESKVDLFNFKKSGLLCFEKTKDEKIKDGWSSRWRIEWQLAPKLFVKSKL